MEKEYERLNKNFKITNVREYDEIGNKEDDIIDFKVIDGKMYLSLENVNKSIDQATKNYKNMIDKAVEYIKSHAIYSKFLGEEEVNTLLDILKETR